MKRDSLNLHSRDKMTIHNLFPVQLGQYRSDLSSEQQAYLENLTNFEDDRDLSLRKIHHGQNILNSNSFLELTSFILDSSRHFLINSFGITNELIVSNSWLNVTSSTTGQAFHSHANSLISGTFYVAFDPSIHPSLVLRHPRSLCSYSSYEDLSIIPTAFNSPLFKPSYSQGDLLLWPSYLEHGFFPRLDTDNLSPARVSLSFNVNIKRTLLHSYSLSFS